MGCGGGVGATGVVEGGGGVIAPAVWRAPAASWGVVSALVRDARSEKPATSAAVIVPRRTNAANTHSPVRRGRFTGGTVVTLGAPVGVASGGGAKVGTVGGSHGTGVGGVITGARVAWGGHAVGGGSAGVTDACGVATSEGAPCITEHARAAWVKASMVGKRCAGSRWSAPWTSAITSGGRSGA